jgi:hypothetical protein
MPMDRRAFEEAESLATELGAVDFVVRRSSVPSLWTVLLFLDNGTEVGYDLICGYNSRFSRHLCSQSLLDQRHYE